MEFFGITAIIKEIKENEIIYYYSTNRIDIDKETAGIFITTTDVFENLPNDLNELYYSNYALKQLIDNQIKQIKIADNALLSAEGIDYHLIVAMRELLKEYKKNFSIPTETSFIDRDRLKKKFAFYPDILKYILDNEKITQEILDVMFYKYRQKTTN